MTNVSIIKKLENMQACVTSRTHTECYKEINSIIEELESAGIDCDGVLDDIVTEDEAEELAKYRLEQCGLCGLGHYISGINYYEELYKVDGYGNLRNVNSTDWENIIDELVYRVKNSDLDDDIDELLRGDADGAI